MSEFIEQRSEAWHQQRKNRVTGSICGAILGLSPYMTRADAMRSMVRASLGEPSEFTGNVATDWGTANEATAIIDFEMDTGLTVEPAPFVPYSDWLGASPDGYVSDGSLIEVKAPYSLRKAEHPVPFKSIDDQEHYMAQIQVQLHVTGRYKCHFWQWAPAGTRHEIVSRDDEWLAHNIPALAQFYAEFIHERDNNADFYRAPLRKEIDNPEAHRALKEWDEIKEAMDNLKDRQADLLAEIVGMAGDVDALVAGRKLTKVVKDGTVSYSKALKELCPDADLEKWRGKSSSFWKLT